MGVYVALSTMDKWWYDGIGREEGVDVLKKCVNECEKRMYFSFYPSAIC
jgi:20S proteasome subunit beta 4